MIEAPRVSVVIPTYNRVHYLRESVKSVLDQTYRDFELIICDDASAEDTSRFCQELARLDPRVKVVRNATNQGMVGNWNIGLQNSRGYYFTKLDDDNLFLPQFLEKSIGVLESNKNIIFTFADEYVIREDGTRDLEASRLTSDLYKRSAIKPGMQNEMALLALQQSCGINATVFKREDLVEIGGFRPLANTAADFDTYLKLASTGKIGFYIAEYLSEYRVHNSQISGDVGFDTSKMRAIVDILESYSFQGEAEQLRCKNLSTAYIGLGRTLAFHREIRLARSCARSAFGLAPTSARSVAALAFLHLPAPIVNSLLKAHYERL